MIDSRGREPPQIVVTVEAGVVAVAEIETDRVVADDGPADDVYAGEFLRSVAAVFVPEDIGLADVGGAGRAGGRRLRRRGIR